jgi:hypothetical protein
VCYLKHEAGASLPFLVVGVAQLVRAPGCGPGGRGFESLHSPHPDFCPPLFSSFMPLVIHRITTNVARASSGQLAPSGKDSVSRISCSCQLPATGWKSRLASLARPHVSLGNAPRALPVNGRVVTPSIHPAPPAVAHIVLVTVERLP